MARPDHEGIRTGTSVPLHGEGLVEDRRHSLDDGMHQAADTAAFHADSLLAHLCDDLLAHRAEAFVDDTALLAGRPPDDMTRRAPERGSASGREGPNPFSRFLITRCAAPAAPPRLCTGPSPFPPLHHHRAGSAKAVLP
ncbi:hypothetical protein ACKI10_34260 [Streptomyces galilaeus]|uniref:Transposase n=1 Tax=Streptomyces galilaeus TaxID=33899 RepID=A0ABW9IMG4_STRGJ